MRMRKEVFILNIDDVLPNRFQPRIKFDEKAIMELAESIKKHGVIQPIIVRKIADKYEIIAGERRYKASVIAGRKTIPAIITDVDDKESAEIALIENVQRQDMTPIEEAISYKKILDMGYVTQSELAVKLGKTQSTIANKLRLLNLSEEVQDALLEEKISERHARSLLKLKAADQPEVLNKIINERLTVRKTDQLINSILNGEEEPTQKIQEEKGENMNNYNDINNNFNIPTEPIVDNTNPNPGFMNIENIQNNAQDITPVQNESVGERQPFNPFGTPVEAPVVEAAAPVAPSPFEMPAAPMPEVAPVETPVVEAAPVATNPFEMPAAPMPEVAPVETPVVEAAPVAPNPFEMPAAPMPEVSPVEAPVVEAAPVAPNPFEIPVAPVQPVEPITFEMPQPVAQAEPTQFGMPAVEQPFASMPNYPLPETQELTPLMPETVVAENRVELNEVINQLRDCIRKIEGLGYKVDSEEADLANQYEFTIKIDKN